jgi:cytochrome c peroxidase
MGLSRVSLVHMLSQNPDLKTSYESLFGPLPDSETWPSSASPASFAVPEDLEAWQSLSELEQSAATEVLVNIAKSIAAFESKIIPPPTKLDTFVDVFATDEDQALDLLTSQQERGLRLFLGEGQCHLCHSGAYLSDKQFHNIGLPITETTPLDDLGRYTGLEILSNNPFNQAGLWSDDPNGDRANQISRLLLSSEDLGRFKTPSLRQLSQTAPYMHTGQFETLYEVVEHYTDVEEDPIHGHAEEFLLPLDWDEDDIEAMVQFLQIVSNNIE